MNKEIIPNIRFLDNCLLIDEKILVLTDFHIGYQDYIYGKESYPRFQLKEILENLDRIFNLLEKEGVMIKQIIILGDLKHEFGEISDVEWRETLELLDYLYNKIENMEEMTLKKGEGIGSKKENRGSGGKETERIVLIKGNHDNVLGPIAKKRGIKVSGYYNINGVCFLHGDRIFEECKSKVLIMGHLHPSVVLSDKYKREKYKCFLKGKWKGKLVYILPSFSPLSLGYDMDNIGSDKDFLFISDKYLRGFEVVIYDSKDNKAYNFGKLKKLIHT
jgi:hypothetical protein